MTNDQIKPTTKSTHAREDALRPGATLLRGQYRIDKYLNAGGFGITYLASDSLERQVVIKECFPNVMCTRSDQSVRASSRSLDTEFATVVKQFVQEARRLAKLRHPNIVGVHQVFEDNGTAYMALDYVEGRDLLDIVESSRDELTPAIIKDMLLKLLDAIAFIHEREILHRDISPDNILVDADWRPVLIDFGAAREVASNKSRALSALQIVKDGYSPQEFYLANNSQSHSSDLYSLAATFYHLIAGKAPPNSQVRLAALAGEEMDPYDPIPPRSEDYDHFFLQALDKALAVFPKDRIASAVAWIEEIDEARRRQALTERAKEDKEIDVAIRQMVLETNSEIQATEKTDEPAPKAQPAKQKAWRFVPLRPADDSNQVSNAIKRTGLGGEAVPRAGAPRRSTSADVVDDSGVDPFQEDVIPPPRRRSVLYRLVSKPLSQLFSRQSNKQDQTRRPQS